MRKELTFDIYKEAEVRALAIMIAELTRVGATFDISKDGHYVTVTLTGGI